MVNVVVSESAQCKPNQHGAVCEYVEEEQRGYEKLRWVPIHFYSHVDVKKKLQKRVKSENLPENLKISIHQSYVAIFRVISKKSNFLKSRVSPSFRLSLFGGPVTTANQHAPTLEEEEVLEWFDERN